MLFFIYKYFLFQINVQHNENKYEVMNGNIIIILPYTNENMIMCNHFNMPFASDNYSINIIYKS